LERKKYKFNAGVINLNTRTATKEISKDRIHRKGC
jgi:hypothetical protein